MSIAVPSNETNRKPTPFEDSLAAGISSIFTTMLTYPLDLIRTHFQANDGIRTKLSYYGNTPKAIQQIVKQDGLRGLYSGMTPSVIGASASWGIYIFAYTHLRDILEDKGIKDHPNVFIAGTLGGMFTALLTNPIWVVKTRMQLQYIGKNNAYGGMIQTIRSIAKEEGIPAFWKGIIPSLLSSYHGAVQFLFFESARKHFSKKHEDGKMTGPEAFVSGGISKIFALLSTQPLSVIKVRLQNQREHAESRVYRGTWHCILTIFREEGFRGFYKGVVPAIWRLGFHSAFFFLFFEKLRQQIVQQRPN